MRRENSGTHVMPAAAELTKRRKSPRPFCDVGAPIRKINFRIAIGGHFTGGQSENAVTGNTLTLSGLLTRAITARSYSPHIAGESG